MFDFSDSLYSNMFSEEDIAVYLDGRTHDLAYDSVANFIQSNPAMQSALNEMDHVDHVSILDNSFVDGSPEHAVAPLSHHEWIFQQTGLDVFSPCDPSAFDNAPRLSFDTTDTCDPNCNVVSSDLSFDENECPITDLEND